MKVLVTGANGFLGQHLSLYLYSKNYTVIAASRGGCRIRHQNLFTYYTVDLTKESEVDKMVSTLQPDIIVHTAAMSKPDECENDKNACIKMNVAATKYLLDSFKKIATERSHFIYTSTDFVFGENGPHGEEDEKQPLNFYGESKLQSEILTQQTGLKYAIVRPVFIYGKIWEGLRPTFLHWVKNNLVQNKKIKVVSDQMRTPTYVMDICKGIEMLIHKGFQGPYHFAGKDLLSPYQMAVATANYLNLDSSLIENVTSESFIEPVKRAKKSGLKIEKAIKDLNYRPLSFEEGIGQTFAQ